MEVPDSRVTDEQANSTPSPILFDCEHNQNDDDDIYIMMKCMSVCLSVCHVFAYFAVPLPS